MRKKSCMCPDGTHIIFVIRPRRICVISVSSTTRAAPKQVGENNGSTDYTKIDRRKKVKKKCLESSKTGKS